MLWVVIGHSPLSMDNMPTYVSLLYKFAYSFHMPLFIMISGWLFYKTRIECSNYGVITWTWGAVVKDKMIRLGIPYVVFTIIAMFAKNLFPGDMDRPSSLTVSELIHAIVYPGSGALGEMWFVACIMWYFILFPVWKFILKKNILIWVSLVVILIIYFLRVEKNLLQVPLLGVGTMLKYIIWFYFGLLLCRINAINVVSLKRVNSWALFVLGTILYILMRYIQFDFGVTICAIVLSLGLVLIFDRVHPKLFYSFRNYTYQIFLMGIFFQIVVKMIYRRIDMPYIICYILCIIVGIYIPVFITKLFEKLNFAPLLLAIGLKKQK